MPTATSHDVVRFATLVKEGRCSDDDIRRAILSGEVKPLFHIDEINVKFKRWEEDGSTCDDPIVFEDDDVPYESFNGYVYLEINRPLGFLDCDFHRFTKFTDVDAGRCPLPQYSVVEHVSMEEVIRQGGVTKSDAQWVEQQLLRRNAAPQDSSHTTMVDEGPFNIKHSTKSRRDALTPAIELAQASCRNPQDDAEVWAVLQVLAEKKQAPLFGATEGGLQYLKDGAAKIFKRSSLKKRLIRIAPISPARRR